MLQKFADLSTRTKLGVGMAAMLIPTAVAVLFNLSMSLAQIGTARSELHGLDWVEPMVQIERNLAEHRDHAVAVASGHDDERAEMQEHAAAIRAADARIDAVIADAPAVLRDAANWPKLEGRIALLLKEGNAPPAEIALAHTGTIEDLRVSMRKVASLSQLPLDPEADTLSLIAASITSMPAGLEALALTRRNFDAWMAGDRGAARHADVARELGAASTLLDSALLTITEDYAQAVPGDTKLAQAAAETRTKFDNVVARLRAHLATEQPTPEQVGALAQDTEVLTEDFATLQDQSLARLRTLLQSRVSHLVWSMAAQVAMVVVFFAAAALIQLWLARYLGSQVGKANEIFGRIAQGHFDNPVEAQAADELGTLMRSIDRMQTDLRERIDAERRVAMENARVRQSLDASSANVMVADENDRIIYANRAAMQLMVEAQDDIRAGVPDFDAANLVGATIDQFHRNPSHQRGILASLQKGFNAEMRMGTRTMRIVANPIQGVDGTRLGTVVEWIDRTQELVVEGEVQALVAETLQGNLGRRISLDGKKGFFRTLSTGLNDLVSNIDDVVVDVQRIVADVNGGDLSRRIELEGKSGLLVKLGTGINQLTDNVAGVVDEVRTLVDAANDGDLTRRIATEGQSGLMVRVGSGINQLTESMAQVVGRVKAAASEVSRGADEISFGATNLSQRTEEQATSLEETASSMEQMTSTVKQNADNASQAEKLAAAARHHAEAGGAVVADAVRAMTGINESSRRIADIIGVIDELAFQTNLLALNAAVEAARAGEQGRGFAVVAGEVRNLAGRSATAAKEIKTLIHDSAERVEEGSKLVTQSGSTLDQIVQSVKKVSDIVAEIAAASNEQSAGIEQVNKAVMQIDQLTQQNAALVEQTSAAAQSMADQARVLNESMRRYTVAAEPGVRKHTVGGAVASALATVGDVPLPHRESRRA
jgi:methyl-accepting chemotaxis protein